jgi:hypothetical protein
MKQNNHASSVYVIKCASFYKIGFSKNPNNRRATIQTHCPLDVELIATFKTHKHIEVESQLHERFLNKRTRGEWFELTPEDLLMLKVELGFTFKKDISKITQDETFSYNSSELISKRIDNQKLGALKTLFEDLFGCKVLNMGNIKYSLNKYGFESCEMAMYDLLNQEYGPSIALSKLKKFSYHNNEKLYNTFEFLTKIICVIYKHHYNEDVGIKERNFILSQMEEISNVDDFVKSINSQKYYLNSSEFWKKFVRHE